MNQKKQKASFAGLSIIGIISIFTFQNCSPTKLSQNAVTDSNSTSVSGIARVALFPVVSSGVVVGSRAQLVLPTTTSSTSQAATGTASSASQAATGTASSASQIAAPPTSTDSTSAVQTQPTSKFPLVTEARIRIGLDNFYNICLHRPPPVEDINRYLAQLGPMPTVEALNEVLMAIYNSPESKLREVIQTVLNREATTQELATLLPQMTSSDKIQNIIQSIKDSNEAKIRGFYLTHLYHLADPAGIAYWLSDIAKGQSLDQVRDNIRRNPSCKNDCLVQ